MSLEDYPVIAEFSAFVRRPKPLASGLKAQLFAANGPDSDAVMALGRSSWQDALVHVEVAFDGEGGGGFEGYVRRPEPSTAGMVAVFFAENGEAADTMSALGLSKFLDRGAHVRVRLVQDADGRDKAKKREKGPHSAAAQALWKSSFFRYPGVWAAAGADGEFLAWLKERACCVNPKHYGPHAGDIVPAHVRRIANGAGEGTKPLYSAIALCHKHHDVQHHDGESALGGKKFFDRQRLRHLQRWAWERVVADLGFSSMTFVPPAALYKWARYRRLDQYLPLEYSLAEFERIGS